MNKKIPKAILEYQYESNFFESKITRVDVKFTLAFGRTLI